VLLEVCENTNNAKGVEREKHVIAELTQLKENQKKQEQREEQAGGS
jgi:hypothetical protein